MTPTGMPDRRAGVGALAVIVLGLWLIGLVGPCRVARGPGGRMSGPTEMTAPILPEDVPPAPAITLASGQRGGSRWSLVVASGDDLRCFGLEVGAAKHRLACNRRTLGREEAFGGIVFAPAELSAPVVFGEVSREVATVQLLWERRGAATARVVANLRGPSQSVKYFVGFVPRAMRRLILVARAAGSDVVGRVRMCCPSSAVRHAPVLGLCHGRPVAQHHGRARVASSEIAELLACPPVDLVRGVEFVAPP